MAAAVDASWVEEGGQPMQVDRKGELVEEEPVAATGEVESSAAEQEFPSVPREAAVVVQLGEAVEVAGWRLR